MKTFNRSLVIVIQTLFFSFCMVGMMGISGCPQQGVVQVQPTDDSRIQQAYAAKDELINAKKALNDLYAAELLRRKTKPSTKPYISDATYQAMWTVAVDATSQVDQAIALARAPRVPGIPDNGASVDSMVNDVKSKTAMVSKATGAQ